MYIFSIVKFLKHAEVQLPKVISQQPKSNQIHLEVELKSDQECYRHHVFVFQVNLYQIVNKSLLGPIQMYIFNSTEIAITNLKSNSTYKVGINAKSINSTEVYSDPLWIDITTLSKKKCFMPLMSIYIYVHIPYAVNGNLLQY